MLSKSFLPFSIKVAAQLKPRINSLGRFTNLKYNFANFDPHSAKNAATESFKQVPTEFNKLINQEVSPEIANKVHQLEQNQPFFDRLMFFDPDFMATLPFWLEPLEPFVEIGKVILYSVAQKSQNMIVGLHDYTQLPWWAVISITCIIARLTIMPLIYVQFKRTSRLTAIVPVVTQMKKLTDKSQLPKYKKWFLFSKITYKIVRQQNLKTYRLFIYNLFHFPIMFTIIFSMRRLLVEESVKTTPFLWIPSLVTIDPYYILPALTCACYYWNLGRFITKENQHTLISRLKSFGQVLMILWLPILANWPAAIVWYMFSNAVFSILQTSVLVHPSFYRFVDPKMMLYQFIIRVVEHDKVQSDTLIDAIRTGEESFKDKAIKEEVLVEKMQDTLKKMEAQELEDTLKKKNLNDLL